MKSRRMLPKAGLSRRRLQRSAGVAASVMLAAALSVGASAPAAAAQPAGGQPVSMQVLPQAALQADPSIVPRGQHTAVSGGGFQPGETVRVRFDQVEVETTAAADGQISTSLEVPIDYPWGMAGIIATGQHVTVSAPLTIVAPVVTLEPEAPDESITSGSEVTIEAEGFAPEATVTVEVTDGAGQVIDVVENVDTDDEGRFSQEWTVPAAAGSAELSIEVIDDEEPAVSDAELLEVEPVSDPVVMISPTPVAPGETVTISSAGFAPDSEVAAEIRDSADVRVTTVEGTTGQGGSFTQTWRVPGAIPWGDYTVDVTEQTDSGVSGSAGFTIAEEIDPSVEVETGEHTSGDEALPGAPVVIQGSGFAPDSTVTVVITEEGGDIVEVVEDVATDDSGDVVEQWILPEDLDTDELEVEITDDTTSEAATAEPIVVGVPVDDPAVEMETAETVPGDEAVPGEPVVIEGGGFTPESQVTVEIKDDQGEVVDTITGVPIDGAGGFVEEWQLPDEVDADELIAEVAEATDDGDSEVVVSDPVVVEQPATPIVTVQPDQNVVGDGAIPGEWVIIEGEGFAPDTAVTVEVMGPDGEVLDTVEDVVADSKGSIVEEWILPEYLDVDELTVELTEVTDGDAAEVVASDTVAVESLLDPSVSIETGDAVAGDATAPGGTVTIGGEGFAPSSVVTVEVSGSAGEVVAIIEDVATDETGAFIEDWTLPEHVDTEELSVEVADPNNPEIAFTQVLPVAEANSVEPTEPEATGSAVHVEVSGVEVEELAVLGEGFVPGSTVTLEITDTAGRVLDSFPVQVEADGTISVPWIVPRSASAYELTITVTDEAGQVTNSAANDVDAEAKETEPEETGPVEPSGSPDSAEQPADGLADTGTSGTVGLGVAALALILLGAALLGRTARLG